MEYTELFFQMCCFEMSHEDVLLAYVIRFKFLWENHKSGFLQGSLAIQETENTSCKGSWVGFVPNRWYGCGKQGCVYRQRGIIPFFKRQNNNKRNALKRKKIQLFITFAYITVGLNWAPVKWERCHNVVLDHNVLMLRVLMWLDDYMKRSGRNCTGFTFQAYGCPACYCSMWWISEGRLGSRLPLKANLSAIPFIWLKKHWTLHLG